MEIEDMEDPEPQVNSFNVEIFLQEVIQFSNCGE